MSDKYLKCPHCKSMVLPERTLLLGTIDLTKGCKETFDTICPVCHGVIKSVAGRTPK